MVCIKNIVENKFNDYNLNCYIYLNIFFLYLIIFKLKKIYILKKKILMIIYGLNIFIWSDYEL